MKQILLLAVAAMMVGGCTSTRSISYHTGNQNYHYAGELAQMDVISSLSADGAVAGAPTVSLAKAARIILIQSGQMTPDAQVATPLGEQFEVLPFSGIPGRIGVTGVSWRQAAKAGGVQAVLVYWGSIETSYENSSTKAISWVPVVGWAIPDQHQQMRVSISYLVADVATGSWVQARVVSRSSQISSSVFTRQSEDALQISDLKQDAYAKLAAAIGGMITK